MGKSDEGDAKTWALEQAIRRRIARDPGWRVLVHERDWLCPFCGKVGVTPYRESRAPRDILLHLVRECPEWGQDKGSRFSHSALQEKARRLQIDESLRTNAAWQVHCSTGRWYCPYCVERTTIRWPADEAAAGAGAEPPVDRVLEHLEACQPYCDKHKPSSAEALRLIVDDADRHRELTATLRRRIEEEPVWRQATADGHWICPECRRPVPEVDLSSDLMLVSLAPTRMARHLLESCGRSEPPPAPAAEKAGGEPAPAQRDLERAREIVQKMLPSEIPRLEGYDLYCVYRPTESVGGDFYDFLRLSDHELAVFIGDVSGHGLEAALIMTMVKKSLKLHAHQHRSPAEVLRRTNTDITSDLDARTFVTACYAVLDDRRGTVAFARAGHNRPVLFNPGRREPVKHLEGRGMALGMYQGGLFDKLIQETEIRLNAGDAFLLYTDGLIEARNPRGEPYGIDRLEAALARSHGDLSSQALADALFDDVRRFAEPAAQEDDIAILCLTARAH